MAPRPACGEGCSSVVHDKEVAGKFRKQLRGKESDHRGELAFLPACLQAMHELKYSVLGFLVFAAFGVQSLPFQAVVAEYLYGLAHVADFVAATCVRYLDVVVLPSQSADDATHFQQRPGHAPHQNEIEDAQKDESGQPQEGFCYCPPEVGLRPRLLQVLLCPGRDEISEVPHAGEQACLRLFVLRRKQGLSCLVSVSLPVVVHGTLLDCIEHFRIRLYRPECRQLRRRQIGGIKGLQEPFKFALAGEGGLKRCQVALLALEHIKPGVLGCLFCCPFEAFYPPILFPGDRDRIPFAICVVGGKYKRRTRQQRQTHGYRVGPVGDRANSHRDPRATQWMPDRRSGLFVAAKYRLKALRRIRDGRQKPCCEAGLWAAKAEGPVMQTHRRPQPRTK